MRETGKWTWHIITAVVVLVFLGLHMAVMHLDDVLGWFNPAGGEATAWENVIARSQTIFFALTYIILLAAALYHGLYGLRNILLEFSQRAWFQRAVNVVLWVTGVGLYALGSWVAIAVQMGI